MKPKIKIIVDLLMTVLLLLLMAYQITGQEIHEWFGTAMLVLFIIHHFLNLRWYGNLGKGRYRLLRIVQTVINFGLLLVMFCLGFSGIVMSRHMFAAFPINGPMATARTMHLAASYWGFVLMSIHIGLHWSMILGMLRKLLNGKEKPGIVEWVLRGAAALFAGYGLYLFLQKNILSYMFLKAQFVFFDFEQGAASVLMEYLAMMGFWIFISCYAACAMNEQKKDITARRKMALLLLIAMLLCLTACENKEPASSSNDTLNNEPSVSASLQTEEQIGEPGAEHRVLIAYFSWTENAVQDDIDAMASPSVKAPGNVARLAGWISEETGGDLFSIRVTEPYPADWDGCLSRANDEKTDGVHPALSEMVEDISGYDTIFLGFPNWWYSCPMAIFSFIEEHDLSGKQIYLFCSHGTGGLAGSVQDITAALPESAMISENVFHVYQDDIDSSQADLQNWMKELQH